MNRQQAVAAIQESGIRATLILAEDECTDDCIALNGMEDCTVQISFTRDGLRFCASVASGEGDDWGVTHGAETKDPVRAAHDALEMV